MLPLWKNLFKKNTIKMNTEKLFSLKENFTGQKFQWIKPDRPELLDDGSRIDTNKLTRNLLMIHGDMQPLTKAEVESIYGSSRQANRIATNASSSPKPQASPGQGPIDIPSELRVDEPMRPTQPTSHAQPTSANSVNMFEMFNSDESEISLKVNVKLPDKKLLKMMYSQAEDKTKFLSELSEYLHKMINKQVIAESMKMQLDPLPQVKKEKEPIIKVQEVDESSK